MQNADREEPFLRKFGYFLFLFMLVLGIIQFAGDRVPQGIGSVVTALLALYLARREPSRKVPESPDE